MALWVNSGLHAMHVSQTRSSSYEDTDVVVIDGG